MLGVCIWNGKGISVWEAEVAGEGESASEQGHAKESGSGEARSLNPARNGLLVWSKHKNLKRSPFMAVVGRHKSTFRVTPPCQRRLPQPRPMSSVLKPPPLPA